MSRNIGCARKPGQAGWVVGRGLKLVMPGKAGAFPAELRVGGPRDERYQQSPEKIANKN